MENYFTPEEESIIIKLYTEEKRGQLYCAKAVGKNNPRKVKEVLRKHNIPIRNFSEAATQSNINRTLYKNKDYFKTQTHNMAWVLGFLASDGTISSSDNTIKIGLSAKDKEILEKIKDEIEIENKIVERVNKDGFDCVDLHWTCKEHKEDLGKYGITPNKTFTIKPPVDLDEKYYIDYIRGYFDGDGSINIIHNKGKIAALRWQVCGASLDILKWIVDILYIKYNIPKVSILRDSRNRINPIYYFQYSTNAVREIYKILYTPDSLYLNRKKIIFDEAIQVK